MSYTKGDGEIDHEQLSRDLSDAVIRLTDQRRELLAALRMQASWKMRDGTPCACPAGRDEDEPSGKMPTEHATSCQHLRDVIAKTEKAIGIEPEPVTP